MANSKKLDGNNNMRDDERSVIELIFVFYTNRRVIYFTTGIAFIVSLFVAFTIPVEFTSKARLLTENTLSNTSTISGLAGLAGINLPIEKNNASMDPGMYPSILESSVFLSDLINEKFYIEELGRDISLLDYLSGYKKENIISKGLLFLFNIPSYIFSFLKPETNNGIKLASSYIYRGVKITTPSPQEQLVINQLKKRIKVSSKDRFIDLSVNMPEARLSAEVNNVVTGKLIDYLVSYKTAKRKSDMLFLEKRTEEARRKFVNAQSALAGYQDSNFGLIFQRGKARQDQLKAQFDLYFGIYNTLAGQLEQARIHLKENTPVFSEFEPVTIPDHPSSPEPVKIIIAFTVVGFISGVFLVGVLLFLLYFKKAFRTLQVRELK
jgi:uncharacterized protein involved in exopolysaccharide biosynthesis